jgi:hypothetical protein
MKTKIRILALLTIPLAAAVIVALKWGVFSEPAPEAVSSRAYVGHETDADMKGFIQAYNTAAGTRLDDCQTCHKGGIPGTDTEREVSPCSYCHLIDFPKPRYETGVPKTYEDTLNAYGLDYKRSGRRPGAFSAIAGRDSDGDGYPNAAEIADLRNPGDPASRPGLPLAPFVTLGWEDIIALPSHGQFMLMNKTRQFLDEYVTYSGPKVSDVLSRAGVDLAGASGITVFAPDGYSIDLGMEEVLTPCPRGFYYESPLEITDPAKALLKKPGAVPGGLEDGAEIPDTPWLLLATEREGRPLETSAYEKGSGELVGEGPFRLVRPVRDLLGDPARPGRPDRSVNAGKFGDGWDYSDGIDHNAGFSVRGACVIRVNPAPPGYEDYDWKNGWSLIGDRKIVLFGYGVKAPGR